MAEGIYDEAEIFMRGPLAMKFYETRQGELLEVDIYNKLEIYWENNQREGRKRDVNYNVYSS